jgi:exosortase D (VPLPA-CTERM-specific)
MSVESLDPDSHGPVWRLSWPAVFVAGGAAAMSLWLFWDGLSIMWANWIGQPEYSHAILIPFVAAFLIWQQKDRLEQISFEENWWGLVLVIVGGVLLLVAQLGTVYTLVQYAYLVTLYGLVLAFTGARAFRLLAMPLFILVLMIPLPQFALYNLSANLQLLSSELGVWIMRLFGISVFVEGNVIDLGGYRLQVAEACDGLRYLFPLMTLGFLLAYFYKGSLWKRVVVFLSSIPITLLMNSVRIGTIGLMVEHWGIGMAEGFLHEFQGWAIFMICTLLMLGELAVLNRLGHDPGTWRSLFGVEFPARTPAGAPRRRRVVSRSFIAATIALTAFVVVAQLTPRPAEIVPVRSKFVEFPMRLGSWAARRDSLDGIYLDQLKLDDYLLADYSNPSGVSVNLYMAYYDSQRKGEAVHSPRSCLPGGGWQLRDFDQRTLPVQIAGRDLRVNRTLIELGNQHDLVYYWFEQRGRVITNEFMVKWYLFWDALTRHRTDGALVRIITSVPPGHSAAEADRALTEFASRLAPELGRYIPD